MKLLLSALAVVAVCSQAMADAASDLFSVPKSNKMDLQSPLGVWEVGPFVIDNVSYTMRFRIGQNQVTAGNKCTANNQSAMVAITVPSTLTPNTLTMDGSDSQAVTQNGVNCNISTTAGSVEQYSISNGLMTLSDSPLKALKISD